MELVKLFIVKVSENEHISQWAKSPKKKSKGVRFLLIRHSKYSAVLSKMHLDCFFGDFAH